MSNKLYYNQYQSIYRTEEYIIVVDFLKNSILKVPSFDMQCEYKFNEEYNEYANRLSNRLNDLEPRNRTLKITVITDFVCNMSCLYCYEACMGIEQIPKKTQPESIISFIVEQYQHNFYSAIRVEIVGGEPLMEHNIAFLDELVFKIQLLEYPTTFSITTNGLNVSKYIEKLLAWNIKDFQITVDGLEKVQNQRRIPHDRNINGFEEIAKGIDILLKNNCFVAFRMNVDCNNVQEIPKLANYILQRGWMNLNFHPYIYPITQSGNCNYSIKDTEAETFHLVMQVLQDTKPKIGNVFSLNFHGLDYIDSIIENKLPRLRLKFCGITDGQFIVSNDGNIYSCWWGVGEKRFHVGDLDGNIDNEKIKKFSERSTNYISRCRECKFRFLCGGGCTYKEWINHNTTDQGQCAEFDLIIGEYIKFRIDDIKESEALEEIWNEYKFTYNNKH